MLTVGRCVCGDDCSGPREDATRIGSAGVVRRQAVDISPLRRVNQVRRLPVLLKVFGGFGRRGMVTPASSQS